MDSREESAFTRGDRKQIGDFVRQLPAELLRRALSIIFGSEDIFKTGQQKFKVNFEVLDDRVCHELASLIHSHDASAQVGPSKRSRKSKRNASKPAKSSRPAKVAKRSAKPRSVSEDEEDPLPFDHEGRVEVRHSVNAPYLPASVLLCKNSRMLLRFDGSGNLQWIAPRSRVTIIRRASGLMDVTMPQGKQLERLLAEEMAASEAVTPTVCDRILAILWGIEASDFMVAQTDGDMWALRMRLETRRYDSASGFAMDLREILSSVVKKAGSESEKGKLALILRSVFEGLWRKAKRGEFDEGAGGTQTGWLGEQAPADRGNHEESSRATMAQGSGPRMRQQTPKKVDDAEEEVKENAASDGGGGAQHPRTLEGLRNSAVPQGVPSHRNLHAALAAEVVGKKLQVFWDTDGEWHPGEITGYDPSASCHEITYSKKKSEWVNLTEEAFTFATTASGDATSLSIQRLGTLVLARQKKQTAPWPGELCLPSLDDLDSIDDVDYAQKRQGKPSPPLLMVLYFNEDAFDLCPPNLVHVIDPKNPRKNFRKRGQQKELDDAWDLAAARFTYMGFRIEKDKF